MDGRAWVIEPLERDSHQVRRFRSGEASLDAFLGSAHKAMALDAGATRVLIDPSEQVSSSGKRDVLGYYTLAATSVDLTALPEPRRSGLPNPVPATLLGRLAVHQDHQRRGLGRTLMLDALRNARLAAEMVASHMVVVDALTDDAERYYAEQYGFLPLMDKARHLFLPMATVRGLV